MFDEDEEVPERQEDRSEFFVLQTQEPETVDQDKDENIAWLIKELTSNQETATKAPNAECAEYWRQRADLVVIEGRAYRKTEDRQGKQLRQLLVPVISRTQLIQLAYDHKRSAHLGREKTLDRLVRRFFPGRGW